MLADEGARVVVSEERTLRGTPVASELTALGAELRDGGHDPEHLDGATLSWSARVHPDAPVVGWAWARGLPVWGEMELGARLATAPYLAVTGTNGKTTVTEMIEACLRADGRDAVACGNIGRSFPEVARERHDVLVVEVSSFQLVMQESFHPVVSVLVNVATDHLDWHGDDAAYRAAKERIHANQRDGDVHVGNRDDAVAAELSSRARCRIRWFRRRRPPTTRSGTRTTCSRRGSRASRTGSVRSRAIGPASVRTPRPRRPLRCHGVDPAAAAGALAEFRPAPHRGDVVATVAGVRFVDNSKATNPHAAAAAIDGAGDAVLIAGGRAKGVDLSPLRARGSAGP